MSTVKTNYNVKVELDTSRFTLDPTTHFTESAVVWNNQSGSFLLSDSGIGGNQNLQQVTDVGNTTTTSSNSV